MTGQVTGTIQMLSALGGARPFLRAVGEDALIYAMGKEPVLETKWVSPWRR